MKVGTLIKVAEQPEDMAAFVYGSHGFVEELSEDGSRALIVALHEDGSVSGSGTIAVGCLEDIDGDPVWAAAKQAHDEAAERGLERARAYDHDREALLAEVGKQNGLTADQVREIVSTVVVWEYEHNPFRS